MRVGPHRYNVSADCEDVSRRSPTPEALRRNLLIRSKSTAYGRVTRRASSGPACVLRVVIPGLGVMRAIQELPPRSHRESAWRATGMASNCLTTAPPTGATSRRRPPRGAFLIPRPLAEEPHSFINPRPLAVRPEELRAIRGAMT